MSGRGCGFCLVLIILLSRAFIMHGRGCGFRFGFNSIISSGINNARTWFLFWFWFQLYYLGGHYQCPDVVLVLVQVTLLLRAFIMPGCGVGSGVG